VNAVPVSGYPCLVADIGGTNARFGWVAAPSAAVTHVQVLPVHEQASPAAAAHAYLTALQTQVGAAYRPPRRAAFALATAVAGDQIELTNAHWNFSVAATRAALGLDLLLALNDFEALALSLPRLRAGQLRAWPGVAMPDASDAADAANTLAVIGPGTGLGVAGVVRSGQGWLALPGEGGHASLSAANDFESDLLAHVRRDYAHVSAERLLSGIGLPTLHAAVLAVNGAAPAVLSTATIVEQGLSGADPWCSQTVDAFCALLGSFAGNVALTLGARGGVYIGGGIVPRLGERFFASRFRERFEAKGRFQSYLTGSPTLLITDTLAALSGAVQALEQHAA
jgi:glucokinase